MYEPSPQPKGPDGPDQTMMGSETHWVSDQTAQGAMMGTETHWVSDQTPQARFQPNSPGPAPNQPNLPGPAPHQPNSPGPAPHRHRQGVGLRLGQGLARHE